MKFRHIALDFNNAAPMQQAVSDKLCEGVFNDYRGVEVIANWQYLANVAKVISQ